MGLFLLVQFFQGAMRRPCCEKQGNNKGAWSKQEDQKLVHYITTHGIGSWHSLPKAAGLDRCGKSCRLRWTNYLRPDIKRGNFDQDEEDLIIKLHALLGNRWSLIAGRLPGRTDNEVKNYWNSNIKKKLVRMGLDPNNHRLHQIPPPRPPNNHEPMISAIPTSSANNKNTDRVSDTTSCIEDETSGSSDINLDLTMAVPSPSPSPSPSPRAIKKRPLEYELAAGTSGEEVENEALPTLLLFI